MKEILFLSQLYDSSFVQINIEKTRNHSKYLITIPVAGQRAFDNEHGKQAIIRIKKK